MISIVLFAVETFAVAIVLTVGTGIVTVGADFYVVPALVPNASDVILSKPASASVAVTPKMFVSSVCGNAESKA